MTRCDAVYSCCVVADAVIMCTILYFMLCSVTRRIRRHSACFEDRTLKCDPVVAGISQSTGAKHAPYTRLLSISIIALYVPYYRCYMHYTLRHIWTNLSFLVLSQKYIVIAQIKLLGLRYYLKEGITKCWNKYIIKLIIYVSTIFFIYT